MTQMGEDSDSSFTRMFYEAEKLAEAILVDE